MDLDNYIAGLSGRLTKKEDGLWTTGATETVSYPENIHDAYAAVEVTSYWFTHRNRCIVSLARRFPPSGPVLDVGGGNGAISLALHSNGIQSIVLEPGPQGAAVARRRGLTVIRATIASAGITASSVSAIGLFDVIEHIADEAGTLASLHHALKGGGWLYMTVPAFNWLWSTEDQIAGHVRRYTVASATGALQKARFEIAFASYLFAPLVPAIFLLRSMPSLFGRIRGINRGVATDHQLSDNIIGRSIGNILRSERKCIEDGKTIPFGSSVIVVGRKA
jgi:SAM-dependent methyltransferase